MQNDQNPGNNSDGDTTPETTPDNAPDNTPDNTGEHPYSGLTPEVILAAVEACGLPASGSLLAMNSYENRVYQIGLEQGGFVIGKFYRPQRWSDESILEEHEFTLALAEMEIPVVAPMSIHGQTLMSHQGFRLALFPRQGGRSPELDNPQHLEWIGRFIGRIHLLGSARAFLHRPEIDVQSFGIESYNYLINNDFIPPELMPAFTTTAEDVLRQCQQLFSQVPDYRRLRLHGDCHPSNVLWTDAGPHFVDLDDCRMGPAMQDLWMLLSGDQVEMQQQLFQLLEGYTDFADFDPRECLLLEALRSLRILHYAAWLARRWGDPAFPHSFPWFNTPRYWEEQILCLREQLSAMSEEPLRTRPQ
ncbi:MAG: serine/threonine protein kinase [Gammaproteobacteria bacterium]|nr:MAG: serine/threonine protein kinase [Gammaproteobacteria bacterium]